MIKLGDGWTFYDPRENELNEDDTRTMAVLITPDYRSIRIICNDFPMCRNYSVMAGGINISGQLKSFTEALSNVIDFSSKGDTSTPADEVNSWGGYNDMKEVMFTTDSLGIRMADFSKSLGL